nr:hypothetical protein [Psychrobacter sp.]
MSKTALSEHFHKYWLRTKYDNKGNAALGISALLLLQGAITLPAQAANASKPGQRVLMIEMTPA